MSKNIGNTIYDRSIMRQIKWVLFIIPITYDILKRRDWI